MYKHLKPEKLELIRRQLIKKGYPGYWPEVSDFVRQEKNWTCEVCGRRHKDVVVNHRDGNKQNLDWDNLQVVCRGYNTSSGSCAPNKPFKCEDCGRPIRHRGYCLACNIEKRELTVST